MSIYTYQEGNLCSTRYLVLATATDSSMTMEDIVTGGDPPSLGWDSDGSQSQPKTSEGPRLKLKWKPENSDPPKPKPKNSIAAKKKKRRQTADSSAESDTDPESTEDEVDQTLDEEQRKERLEKREKLKIARKMYVAADRIEGCDEKDYYRILGLKYIDENRPSVNKIIKKYREISRLVHTDKNGAKFAKHSFRSKSSLLLPLYV